MTRKDKVERQEAIERLREEIKPGDKIYTILRHRSRSGMQRSISLIQIDAQGTTREWDYLAARAMGDRIDNVNGGIKVGGCGMDMGFHLVYNLGRTLFPEGFGCVGAGEGEEGNQRGRCRSNDHSNGDRDYTPHGHRGPRYDGSKESLSHWHRDGGYALVHAWL